MSDPIAPTVCDAPEFPLEKWQRTVDIMARIFKAPAGFIVRYREDGYEVVIASRQESNPYGAGGLIPLDTNIFCREVVAANRRLYVSNASRETRWDDNPEVRDDGFESYLGLPIRWPDGRPFGTICVMDFAVTGYDPDYQSLMEQFRELVQMDLELLEQCRLLRELSLSDELSGLRNRRGFVTLGEQKAAIARRYGHRFALLYLDLDNLKAINDRHGHAAGDQAIRALAEVLREVLRSSDLAGRIGGDEFAALVFLDEDEDVRRLTERIQDALARRVAGQPELACLGVSIGHAAGRNDDAEGAAGAAEAIDDLIRRADRAMYGHKARRAG